MTHGVNNLKIKKNLKYRDYQEDSGLHFRIIKTDLYDRKNGKCGMHSCGSGQGPVTRHCEDGSELSDSIKRFLAG